MTEIQSFEQLSSMKQGCCRPGLIKFCITFLLPGLLPSAVLHASPGTEALGAFEHSLMHVRIELLAAAISRIDTMRNFRWCSAE
jgi:hypothetical protein